MATVDDAYSIGPEVPDPELIAKWLGVDYAHIHSTYVDQDHDGILDHIRWQIPLDQFPVHMLADPNWNGVPDGNTRLVDLDGDGFYETHLNPLDLDHDGQVDHWVGYTGAPHIDLVPEILSEPSFLDGFFPSDSPAIPGPQMPGDIDGLDILTSVSVLDDPTTHSYATDLVPDHLGGEAAPDDVMGADIADAL